ncbi:hypothetical protein FRC06_007116, partial [Ceratobasidium sp. 370]
TVAPNFFGGPPDILVAGPNLRTVIINSEDNLGDITPISDPVGVATKAAKQGLPAIAFSGRSGSARSYTKLKAGDSPFIYAQIAQKLAAALTATAKPWMPKGAGLNVNLPKISSTCASVGDFRFVLTHVYGSHHNTTIHPHSAMYMMS